MGKPKERPSLPRIRRTGLDRAATVASDPDAARIEQMLTDILSRTEALLTQEEAVELPEVFDLQPLARRRVSIRITGVKAAAFQFAPEDEIAFGDDNG